MPIDIDEEKNVRFLQNSECADIVNIYPAYYKKIGYNKPWIGYVISDDDELIGVGGYKGKPVNGKVEIAYGVFQNHQGKGVATAICKELVRISLQTDPSVRITACTLQEGFASQAVLRKNGFMCLGTVHDDEDGEVLEWEYKTSNV